VFKRLHVDSPAAFVVRPDGHVGVRVDGNDLGPINRYLRRVGEPPCQS
jgi:hypothetical protein